MFNRDSYNKAKVVPADLSDPMGRARSRLGAAASLSCYFAPITAAGGTESVGCLILPPTGSATKILLRLTAHLGTLQDGCRCLSMADCDILVGAIFRAVPMAELVLFGPPDSDNPPVKTASIQCFTDKDPHPFVGLLLLALDGVPNLDSLSAPSATGGDAIIAALAALGPPGFSPLALPALPAIPASYSPAALIKHPVFIAWVGDLSLADKVSAILTALKIFSLSSQAHVYNATIISWDFIESTYPHAADGSDLDSCCEIIAANLCNLLHTEDTYPAPSTLPLLRGVLVPIRAGSYSPIQLIATLNRQLGASASKAWDKHNEW